MKLLTRTNIYFTAIALLIFAVGGVVFYHSIRYTTRNDADERLSHEKEKVLHYIKSHQALPPVSLSLGDSIAYYQTASAQVKDRFTDTVLFVRSEQEYEAYRSLYFGACTGSKCYLVVLFKPLIESDDLTSAIVQTIGIIGATLLIVLILSNILISKNVWKPFYNTLDKIKSFNLTEENRIAFDSTSVKEFNTLNIALKAMTEKISSDYRNLKEFTENASHELQTPLSIIQSKVELLIQSENLSAEQMEKIQTVYESAARLAKLNQALLLLAKIENRQFAEIKQVVLNEVIEHKLDVFDELIKHKNLSVKRHIEPYSVQMHPILADILLSNLIGNAIKHNIEGGSLKIELTRQKFTISNSGKPLLSSPELFFQRFRKANPASESLGLGLAIAKEICNAYKLNIQYKYEADRHIVSIFF